MNEYGHLRSFTMTLKTIGPVFVGNGKKYGKKDYLFAPATGKVTILDQHKLFSVLVEKGLVDEYERYILASDQYLSQFLRSTCGLGNGEIQSIARYTVQAGDALDQNHSLREIDCFIRGADGSAYVPGSSLKGAIRTALLNNILKDQTPARTNQTLREADYFLTLGCVSNTSNAVNSVMRGIQVSDSEPIPDGRFVLARKMDILMDGTVKKLPVCRECIAPGTVLTFRLTLDRTILGEGLTEREILKAIASFMELQRNQYAAAFQLPSGAMKLPRGSYLLLGGGTGYLSKTATYSYYGEQGGLEKAVDCLSRTKAFQRHHHERDIDRGLSPRTAKYTRCGGALVPFGLCEVVLK